MTYYAILMDPDYMGVYRIKESRTLKSACATLRKLIGDENAEFGMITTKKPKMGHIYSEYPPELVGTMNITLSRRKINVGPAFGQQKVRIPREEYTFHKRIPHKNIKSWPSYIVLYDGTLKAI